ncbi:MAG: PQQ-binding-like beta-propeller repeat protein [Halobacteriaceae archaeon]
MHAFNATTGEQQWTAEFDREDDRPIAGQPGLAVDDTSVYFSTYNGCRRINRSDGDERWLSDIGLVAPVMSEGTLYGVGFGDDVSLGTYGINVANGELTWQGEQADDNALPAGPLALDDEHVYTIIGSGVIRAQSRSDGSEAWSHALERNDTPNFTSRIFPQHPVTADDLVLAGLSGALIRNHRVANRLVALSTSEGEEQWTFEAPSESTLSVAPIIHDGTVVVGTTNLQDGESELHGLRADDGEERWSEEIDGTTFGSPVCDGRRVYVPLPRGYAAHRLDDGSEVWNEGDVGSLIPHHGTALGSGGLYPKPTSDHVRGLRDD